MDLKKIKKIIKKIKRRQTYYSVDYKQNHIKPRSDYEPDGEAVNGYVVKLNRM